MLDILRFRKSTNYDCHLVQTELLPDKTAWLATGSPTSTHFLFPKENLISEWVATVSVIIIETSINEKDEANRAERSQHSTIRGGGLILGRKLRWSEPEPAKKLTVQKTENNPLMTSARGLLTQQQTFRRIQETWPGREPLFFYNRNRSIDTAHDESSTWIGCSSRLKIFRNPEITHKHNVLTKNVLNEFA